MCVIGCCVEQMALAGVLATRVVAPLAAGIGVGGGGKAIDYVLELLFPIQQADRLDQLAWNWILFYFVSDV